MSALEGIPDLALRDGALDRVRRLVEIESPSGDAVGLSAVAAELVDELVSAGAEVETVPVSVGEHVRATLPGDDPALAPILILGHLDTVHPVGAFEPVFRVDRGRAHGPGTFDMKGGWACVVEALVRLRSAGAGPRRPLMILATCDEETGSDHSIDLIREMAAPAHAVLVPEPPLPGGAAKTRRKGVGWYSLLVSGRASHAGLAPEAGVNAVVELAHQILAAHALSDADRGTTVSAGVVRGGTTPNVVPDRASVTIDARFATAAEAARLDQAIRGLAPVLDGAGIEVRGGINRPPMERTEAVAGLYHRARELAAESGWELGEGLSGGASDGSITAGMGIPTLDGIGPEGDGAHASTEHVLVDDLARRVRLYARLMEVL